MKGLEHCISARSAGPHVALAAALPASALAFAKNRVRRSHASGSTRMAAMPSTLSPKPPLGYSKRLYTVQHLTQLSSSKVGDSVSLYNGLLLFKDPGPHRPRYASVSRRRVAVLNRVGK
jgi:hypothetical protein